MSMEIGGHKIDDWMFYVGGGVLVLAIWYFMSGQNASSTSSSSRSGSGLSSYLNALSQYDQQQQAAQAQQTATQDQYNLSSQQLSDQLSASNTAANDALQTQALSSASSLGSSIASLGASDANATLSGMNNAYLGNLSAGESVANNALTQAANTQIAALTNDTAQVASYNATAQNVVNYQNNTLSNLYASLGGTAATAASTPNQTFSLGASFGGGKGSISL